MANPFDAGIWRERSWDRLKKSLGSGVERNSVELKWAQEVIHIADIKKVDDWCRSRGISVLFGKRVAGAYDPVVNEIVIVARAHPMRQLCYLLHECGHYLIGTKEYNERFFEGYPKSGDPAALRSFLHRSTCLEEEFEAWHRGWRLAGRLGLSLQREKFDEVRLECIRSYCKWVLKPGDWKEE